MVCSSTPGSPRGRVPSHDDVESAGNAQLPVFEHFRDTHRLPPCGLVCDGGGYKLLLNLHDGPHCSIATSATFEVCGRRPGCLRKTSQPTKKAGAAAGRSLMRWNAAPPGVEAAFNGSVTARHTASLLPAPPWPSSPQHHSL